MMKNEKVVFNFSLDSLKALIEEKKCKLNPSVLLSKFGKEQFSRLEQSGLLGFKPGRKTISSININYRKIAKALNLNILLRGCATGTLIGEYGDCRAEKVNIEKVTDNQFVLSAIEGWVVNGDNSKEHVLSLFAQRDEGKRAESLGLTLSDYKLNKEKGLIDWDPNRAYNVVRGRNGFIFMFQGEEEFVAYGKEKISAYEVNLSCGRTSHLACRLIALKREIQSIEHIEEESRRFKNKWESRHPLPDRNPTPKRHSCTSFSYDADGRQCASHRYYSDGSVESNSLHCS